MSEERYDFSIAVKSNPNFNVVIMLDDYGCAVAKISAPKFGRFQPPVELCIELLKQLAPGKIAKILPVLED